MVANKDDFRNAMSRLAASVQVVTSDGPEGRTGFTATAVCSVTDTPPRLLVCLNSGSSSLPFVVGNGRICVNVLAEDQRQIAMDFGGGLPREQRFDSGSWQKTSGGCWALDGAVVNFDCVIAEKMDSGSHTVFFADVLHCVTRTEPLPLIYADRDFTTIEGTPTNA